MAEFERPEVVADRAQTQFLEQYQTRLAIALKESWTPQMGAMLGLNRAPTDDDFRRWAGELINDRQVTNPSDSSRRLTITQMQNFLSPAARQGLTSSFGTDDLNQVILTRSQLNDASQEVRQATFDHRGGMSFLQGATIVDAFMGFLSWMLGGFQGNLFDSIRRRATDGATNDLENGLTRRVATINPGVRRFISSQFRLGAQQAVGLATAATPPTLEATVLGASAAPPVVPQPSPIPTATGSTPEERLRNAFTQFSDGLISELPQTSPLRPRFQVLQPHLIQAGVTVMLDPGNQALLRSGTAENMETLAGRYADLLLNNEGTRRQVALLIDENNPTATPERLRPQLTGILRASLVDPSIRGGILQALDAAGRPVAPPPTSSVAPPPPPPPPPGTFNAQAVSAVLRPAILNYLTQQNSQISETPGQPSRRATTEQLNSRADRIAAITTEVVRSTPGLVNDNRQLAGAMSRAIVDDPILARDLRAVARAMPDVDGDRARSLPDNMLGNFALNTAVTGRLTTEIQNTFTANNNQLLTQLSAAVNGTSSSVTPNASANQAPLDLSALWNDIQVALGPTARTVGHTLTSVGDTIVAPIRNAAVPITTLVGSMVNRFSR
jgi:hypothetical protein